MENQIVPEHLPVEIKPKKRRRQLSGSPKSPPKLLSPNKTRYKLLIRVGGECIWTDFWWPGRFVVPPGILPEQVTIPLPLQVEEFPYNVFNIAEPDPEKVAAIKKANASERNRKVYARKNAKQVED